MVEVTLMYNAYQNTMRIMADGQPLNNISALTRYQSMPFLVWCGEILSKLEEEVNDDYALTYVGRTCESRILAGLSAHSRACRSLRPKSPTLADSTTKRLRKLSQLCMSGVSCPQFTETLPIYSDIPQAELEQNLKGVLPKLSFCRIRMQCKPLNMLPASPRDEIRFVIARAEEHARLQQIIRFDEGETYVMLLGGTNEFISVQGACITEKVTADALCSVLSQYLELSFFMKLLRRSLSLVQIDEKDANYPSVAVLDKIEPQTYALLPTSIELNQTITLKRYTVPEGYEPSEIVCRSSNPEVVRVQGDAMTCVGTGEVIVEVYQPGQSVCISRRRIVAHRRNRITALSFKQQRIEMAVGDKQKLQISYSPEDADNASQIKYRSDDGTIASAIDGMLTARRPGVTGIVAMTDDKVTAECDVKVYPKLEDILLTVEQTKLKYHGVTNVKVQRVPEDATLDDLVFSVEPQDLAVFDRAGMKLAAREAGSGVLRVMDKRRSVKKEVPFTVSPEKKSKAPAFKFLIGALIIVGILYVISTLLNS